MNLNVWAFLALVAVMGGLAAMVKEIAGRDTRASLAVARFHIARVAFLADQLAVRTSQRDQLIERREAELRTYLEGQERASKTVDDLGGRLGAARVAISDYRGILASLTDDNADWPEVEAAVRNGRALLQRPEADWGLPA